MLSAPSLIDELDTALRQGSAAERAVMLQRVTDLFLQHAESYNAEQIGLFDDVMNRLAERIEQRALAQLSLQLAPVGNAPVNIVNRLARDDDIDVSRPVVQQSTVLSDTILIEIANTKSQDHLAAIAGRTSVSEPVTDILVDRGNTDVTLKVTQNSGARFSRHALIKVADRACDNEALAETIVNRHDVPPDMIDELVSKATEVVRQRLLKTASPAMRSRIDLALAAISSQVADAEAQQPQSGALQSPQDGRWLKMRLGELARSGRRSDTIAALATLSMLPTRAIQSLLRAEAEDGVLILCKAIGLEWSDARSVLAVMTGRSRSDPVRDKAAADKYSRLTPETAHRVIQFVKACKAVTKAELQGML